jgi:hypothetical protein
VPSIETNASDAGALLDRGVVRVGFA